MLLPLAVAVKNPSHEIRAAVSHALRLEQTASLLRGQRDCPVHDAVKPLRAATGPRTSATPTVRGRAESGRSAPNSTARGCAADPRPTIGSRTFPRRAATPGW